MILIKFKAEEVFKVVKICYFYDLLIRFLQFCRSKIKRPEAKKTIESHTKKIDFVSRASKTFVKQTFQTISILKPPFVSKDISKTKPMSMS